MATGTLHMKIGSNLGNVLLGIAQDNIVNGEPERAFETYTKSFNGMDESYALQILKNKFVVETCEDGVNITYYRDTYGENTEQFYLELFKHINELMSR